VDHLCCGEFGRIEFLKSAGEADAAMSRAIRIFEESKRCGSYMLLPNVQGVTDPGFFQGLAGIGYSWLRLAEVNRLPNVLLLE
jgi:lantibiotic modifying enzyme